MAHTQPRKSISSMLFQDQPAGFIGLFFTELWERFCFYGTRALLVLYMTSQLLMQDELALTTYATFMAMLYISPLLGGYLADKLVGKELAVGIGLSLMLVSYGCLFFAEAALFNVGLAFLIVGTGFFKPNIISSFGELYGSHDPRREVGFTYFHTAVNVGGAFGPLICGYIGQTYGWGYGFGLAGVGICFGLYTFWQAMRAHIARKGSILANNPYPLSWKLGAVVFSTIGAVPVVFYLLNNHSLMDVVVPVIGICSLGFWIYVAYKADGWQKKALFGMLIFMALNVFFVAILEQSGGAINLFIHRNLDRQFLGWEIPASMFQSVNPFLITFLGPLLAGVWERWAKEGKTLGAGMFFGLSLCQMGLGLALLYFGCYLSHATGAMPMSWLLFAYVFISSGELFILPIGLSLVTRVAPSQYVGAMTAIWFLSLAFAHYLGGIIARWIFAVPLTGDVVDPLVSIEVYGQAFGGLGIISMVLGALVLWGSKGLETLVPRQ